MNNPLPVLTDSVHLSFDVYGSGEPALLLLHGFPLDHTIWAKQIQAFENTCQLIVPDLRGHGKSPAPRGAYTMDLFVRDILAMLDQLGVYKAIWVGHSMAGYATMAAWRLAPERFAGIGFVATNHKADSEEGKAKRYELAAKVAEQGAAAAINPKLFRAGTPEDSPQVQRVREIMLNTPPDGIIGTLNAMAARPDSTETVKTIHVPTVVVGGADDQLFRPEIPTEMAGLIRGAKLVMADQSGHLPMIEQPELVNDALMWLIQSADGQR